MSKIHATDGARQAEHELFALNRPPVPSDMSTPWVGSGIDPVWRRRHFDSTASHGGFHPDATANAVLPAPYRSKNGWYEAALVRLLRRTPAVP